MKLKLTFALLAVVIIIACNDRTLEQLNKANAEVTRIKNERDSIRDHLDSTLVALERNLGMKDNEVSQDMKERIKNDLAALEKSKNENEKRIGTLRSINRTSKNENNNLMAELESNQQELSKREQMLENLNQQIFRMERKIKMQDSLNSQLVNTGNNQSKRMDELQRRLNTAYVIVGKFKELKNKELVEKKGGFLHLFGRVPKLNPEYNKSLFATLNIRKDTVISLNMNEEQIKLITIHPSGSYKIVNTGQNSSELAIRDPDKFWEASNFLVIAEK